MTFRYRDARGVLREVELGIYIRTHSQEFVVRRAHGAGRELATAITFDAAVSAAVKQLKGTLTA